MKDFVWTCRCCGKPQTGLPVDQAFKAPDNYFHVPEGEREQRARLDHDFCMVDDEFYIRGVIELPIIGHGEKFRWGVWVSLSQASARHVLEVWNGPEETSAGPFFGWLSNDISRYPETLNLKADVHLQGGSLAPRIELEPTDHPLAVEQRAGIPLRSVIEIATSSRPQH